MKYSALLLTQHSIWNQQKLGINLTGHPVMFWSAPQLCIQCSPQIYTVSGWKILRAFKDNMVPSPNVLGVLCRHVNRAASLHPWSCISQCQNMSTKRSDPNYRPTEAFYESLPTFSTGTSTASFVGRSTTRSMVYKKHL